MLFCREHHTLKPHLPALFIAAAGAGWPLRLCAASPDPPFLRLAAEAWMSFEHPLLRLFLFLAILSLLAAALLKRRRRPELLAACLALSIVLHLLSLSCFSLLPIRNPKPAGEPPRAARRIKVGTRVAGESRVSWLVRYEPLKIERADARDRFLTPRAAGSEPIKEVIQKAQAAAPEPAARTAKQVDFKTPDPNPAKKKLDEPLDSTQDRPLEAEAVKIEIPRENMPAREAAQANPDPGEKRLDVGAAARTPMPRQDVKPEAPAAGPKNASPLPVQAKIAPAAAAPRQPEVKDAIHPSSAKPAVDRLALPAGEIANDRDSGKDGAAATARPGADVKLDKRAGSAPQPAGGRQMLAAAKSDGRARMSADSLADGSPGSIDRKQSEVQELAPGAMAAATAVEPLRMNDVQPLVAADRTPAPGRNPAADTAAQRELTAARKKGAVPSLGAAGERPRAEAKNAAPSREPARVGLGGEALAEPASKAPAVRDVISDASAKQPGLRSLEKSPSKNMELATDNRDSAGPAMNNLGASDLAAVKISAGSGNLHAAPVPAAPKRDGRSRHAGAAPGTLVEGSGAAIRAGNSAAVQDQLALAQAGAGDLLEHGLPVAATPAQTLEGARGNVPGKEPVIRPAALSASRKSYSGMPSAAGGIAHPSPAGRSEPTAGGDSFVRQDRNAGLATSPAASPAVSQGEQVDSAASLALAAGNSKALAGQVSVESPQGEQEAAGAEIQGGREQAGISLEKVGGHAPDPGVPGRPFQAPGNAGSGLPAAQPQTLVAQSGLQAAGRPAASGTAREESLAALDTHAGAPDSSGPALAAPAAIHRGALPDGAAEAGGGPAGRGSLPIEKAGADNAFLFEPPAGGLGEPSNTIGAADRREHSRMDLAMGADAPRARVTADISASTSGQDARRSFLPMGKAPTPDFVPEIAIYKMRKPEKRKQFIKELGGTPQTEEAVEQALAWLSRSQSDDGRWDVDGFKTLKECGGAGDLVTEDVGVTGLVLLAYLGAGYTHLEGAYRETVRKGLDWLLSCQKENGDIRGAGQMYGQAMATTALCESYALTGDERLLEPTRRAVKFILDSQTPESGWQYASQNDSDTSVTGWQILALKSARIAGFDVPDQTFRWMSLWLDKVRQGNDGGLYSYKPGHVVTPVMTAEGAFCHLFIGEEAGAGARAESVAFIMQNLPAWDPEKRSVHIYYWYYATLTMYLSGAKEFESWNSALTGALLKGRNTSGPAAGSWDPVCLLGVRGGRIYTTAVGALCLEVYYRFLPLYKQNQD